jgi:DNA polymerase (family 10)
MDLDDQHCRMAKDYEVKIAISTDSHSTGQLRNMQLGVGEARRGWLTAKEVINTWPLKKILKYLNK